MLIFKKEKEARKLVMEHAGTVADCLAESRGVLEEYLCGNTANSDSWADAVHKLESRCDELKFEVRDALNRGAFLPIIRADIYALVESVDVIAGVAEDVTDFVTTQYPSVPEDLNSDFLEVFNASLECFSELQKAMKAFFKPKGQIESLQDHAKQVSNLETDVDRLERQLIRKIFRSDMQLSNKIHLSALISDITSIADYTEDVSDQLETAAMRSMI